MFTHSPLGASVVHAGRKPFAASKVATLAGGTASAVHGLSVNGNGTAWPGTARYVRVPADGANGQSGPSDAVVSYAPTTQGDGLLLLRSRYVTGYSNSDAVTPIGDTMEQQTTTDNVVDKAAGAAVVTGNPEAIREASEKHAALSERLASLAPDDQAGAYEAVASAAASEALKAEAAGASVEIVERLQELQAQATSKATAILGEAQKAAETSEDALFKAALDDLADEDDVTADGPVPVRARRVKYARSRRRSGTRGRRGQRLARDHYRKLAMLAVAAFSARPHDPRDQSQQAPRDVGTHRVARQRQKNYAEQAIRALLSDSYFMVWYSDDPEGDGIRIEAHDLAVDTDYTAYNDAGQRVDEVTAWLVIDQPTSADDDGS